MRSFKELLTERRYLLGGWVKLPCVESVELMALAGFDFITLDMEHAPLDIEMVNRAIVVAQGCGILPLVRIPEDGRSTATRLIDAGAMGILVPHIHSPEDAVERISSLLFEPRGKRGFSPTGRAARWGHMKPGEYKQYGDAQVARIAMIEDPDGVTHLPAILETDGVDAIFIGTGDLTASMGYAGQPSAQPAVQKLVDETLAGCKVKQVPCGIPVRAVDQLSALAAQGFTFFLLGNDAMLLGRAATDQVQQARTILEGDTTRQPV